ncbi:MAG: acetate uptake transporter [Chloroflexota bacterium]
MAEQPLANPAVVGLTGFGGTTLLLQFHNLGWCDVGPVFWSALFFGGLMQLIAGFMEFRTGNNFGFAAFSTYGAFWMALGGIFSSISFGFFDISGKDVGFFLLIFTFITFIFFIGSMKQNWMLAFLFFTLLIGFIFLDISHLGGPAYFTKVAAIDLIICALTAWYLMAHVIYSQFGWKLPVGSPWVK